MRVLFFLPHSHEAPGCRYRVYQYIPYLQQQGVECEVRALVDSNLYRIVYKNGHGLQKAASFAKRSLTRIRDLDDAKHFDLLFVYRECFPIGPAFIESYLRTLGKPIVYDFDDAIYLPRPNVFKTLIRHPQKTANIVQLADRVIVSNDHLRGFCAAYNRNVDVIPTSVDMARFCPAERTERRRPLRIGWIGTHSTARYLNILRRPLQRLASRFDFELFVVGAGRNIEIPGVQVVNKTWSLDEEVQDFQSLDIGIYPLEDDVWELGKAGFKAIQYMAVGVPAVASPVGVTRQIITDGRDGYLAATEEQWLEKLTKLAEDEAERDRLGRAGRESAVLRYSTAQNAPLLFRSLKSAVHGFVPPQ